MFKALKILQISSGCRLVLLSVCALKMVFIHGLGSVNGKVGWTEQHYSSKSETGSVMLVHRTGEMPKDRGSGSERHNKSINVINEFKYQQSFSCTAPLSFGRLLIKLIMW